MVFSNLSDYNNKKSKDLISVKRIDSENFAVVLKQYNPEDGTELPPNVQGVKMSEVNQAIELKQNELDALVAFKNDLLASE